jgi:hypothetical protein
LPTTNENASEIFSKIIEYEKDKNDEFYVRAETLS